MMSQTYGERFTQKPISLPEKPKTPLTISHRDNQLLAAQPSDLNHQQPLFESQVPLVELPKEITHEHVQEPSVHDKPRTPQSSVLPSVGKKPFSHGGSVDGSKPLHKRIDKDEYVKDLQSFYGASKQLEAPSKINRLIEELDNQKKVMEKLDRKQKDVLVNSRLESRKTAAQMIDKFIQTA